MNILEIKNNLVKLSYSSDENPILGRFIVLNGNEKSYVAQYVNLKSDQANNFAIAKLLFTFNTEGLVDNYDGSIPDVNSEISSLSADELLELLPVETPVKIGKLSQLNEILNLDISVFEGNLTVFSEKDSHRTNFISNCVKQLFQMKEKSVIVDDSNLFEDYPRIRLGIDYKLPLNSKMIDYIFEYELNEVDAQTKAVIQDIFYAVQQYIKTLDFEFLPIDNFVDVVTAQYKESQMPELALLKNKLLKYRDAGVFANTKEEVLSIKDALNRKNCSIIDLKDINDSLQKEIISYLHGILNSYEKYIYLFVLLNDDNSDKKLIKQLINHNHVFTTMLVSGSYKYAQELYQHAQNILLFAPVVMNNEFAPYNTFLNKLNQDECVVYGKLTQGIPFIVEITDMDTGLTKDDVLGDKYQFIPKADEQVFMQPANKDVSLEEPQEMPEIAEDLGDIEDTEIVDNESVIETPDMSTLNPEEEIVEEVSELNNSVQEDVKDIQQAHLIEPTANILEEEDLMTQEADIVEDEFSSAVEDFDELEEQNGNSDYSSSDVVEDYSNQDLHDLPPVVPVYPAEDQSESVSDDDGLEFKQGDSVTHPRYGKGFVEKIIKYGNKTLCSIAFDNVGRRLLDPSISELTKI